jgi:hypothetical protein
VDRPSPRQGVNALMQLPVDEQLFDGFADVSLLECEIASKAGNLVSNCLLNKIVRELTFAQAAA